MKIAIAQLNSTDDVQHNFLQIKKIILDAKTEKPEVIFFPENSLYFRIDPSSDIKAVLLDNLIICDLKKICEDTQIAIHITTAILENGKTYNASIYIDNTGGARVVYRKIHLFDIELAGQLPIRESDFFEQGLRPEIFQIRDFKIGSSICYDVRFAELYSVYAKAEVDIVVVPAAFLVKTGGAHWETLLRARAIESQCYVVAAAQAGEHKSVTGLVRETYGHSMLIDPWGRIVVLKQDGVGVIYGEILHEAVQFVRQQIPMRNHRRIDL